MCFPDSNTYPKGLLLPTELLKLIVEIFILTYLFTRRDESLLGKYVRFTPRWCLLPLLRVSKLWHAITVKYLYQTIAVGSHGPFRIPANYYMHVDLSPYKRDDNPFRQTYRKGPNVAYDLNGALSRKSSLAALITKLQLGIEVTYLDLSAWPDSYGARNAFRKAHRIIV